MMVYTRITDNLFRENESHRNYDREGELVYTAKNTSNSTKISDETYTPTREKLASLIKFLKDHGMNDEIKNVQDCTSKINIVP